MTWQAVQSKLENLETLRERLQVDAVNCQAEAEALQADIGQRLLDSELEGGNTDKLTAKIAGQVDALRVKREGLHATLEALDKRLDATRWELSQAQAAALLELADKLERELESKRAKLRKLDEERAKLDGLGSAMAIPEYSETYQAEQRIARMRSAAVVLRDTGRCPADVRTGLPYIRELS